jgi:hypothetical protein
VSVTGTAYGTGTYVTTQSSFNTGAQAAYCLFDKNLATTVWLSSGTAYQPSSGYTGSVSTTVSGTAYKGEWIQIQLPSSIILSSFSFWYNSTASQYAPTKWVLAGSNDGTTWTVVQFQLTPLAFTSNNQLVSTGFSGVAYSYYKFIILGVGASVGANSSAGLTEFKLFGITQSSITQFPPVSLTAASTTLSGQSQSKANGTYVVSTSPNAQTAAGYAYQMFNNTISAGTFWVSASTYSTSTFLYTGSVSTTLLTGTVPAASGTGTTALSAGSMLGEWFDILLPSAITLTSYNLQGRGPTGDIPNSWALLGTNNPSSGWTVVDYQVAINGTTPYNSSSIGNPLGSPAVFSVSASTAYNEYRFICNRSEQGDLDGSVALAIFNLFGY